MNHLFSDYKYIIILLLLFSTFSCKKEEAESDFDSLKIRIDNVKQQDTTSETSEAFENIISDYSQKHNAVTDLSGIARLNSSDAIRNLKNRYIIIPIDKKQISLINTGGSTDTVMTYFGSNSSAFVYNSEGGREIIKSLNPEKNGILLFKVKSVDVSKKIYLTKGDRDFQHKERKVTEYYLSGDIVDAFSISIAKENLFKKFNYE